ncbi:HEPN domain-containing protein [Bacillus sp. CHD6a]|uniref:ApeA N-terminal domain 1-containing protein n=1 Tax=Bacillus sp. CHD6a TaxID=1643452 RepID=UPI0006CC6BD8|nr:HEPN domain-containing protein [Bacillus sp. CHD6a]KPB06320.1 hypothetical protein AAV98_00495 [Bacillus sp. CHD6a]
MASVHASKQSMFNEFELKGNWWLPNSDKKVSGILFYKHDKITLELIGDLNNSEGRSLYFNSDTFDTSCILGFTDKGEKITLFDSIKINSNTHIPGFSTETYSIQKFIVGGHFNKQNDLINFHSMIFYPTLFNKWTAKVPFTRTVLIEDDKVKGIDNIKFTKPNLFKVHVDSINASVEEAYTTNLSGNVNEDIKWVYRGGFNIIPTVFQTASWFEKQMYSLRNLFTLFLGTSTYFDSIILYGEIDNPNVNTRKKYHLFFVQKEVKQPKKFESFDVLVNLHEIEHNLSAVLNSWFSKREKLKEVLNLYLSNFYSKMYLEKKFLNAVQTLEVYHRNTKEGIMFEDAEYTQSVEKLRDILNDNEFNKDFIEILENKLAFANEYSLSKRLKELINGLSQNNKTTLIGNSDNRKRFILQLVDTRNYLTHYDKSNKKFVLSGQEQYFAIERMNALITIYLYKELGIKEELITDKLFQNKQFNFSLVAAKEILNK